MNGTRRLPSLLVAVLLLPISACATGSPPATIDPSLREVRGQVRLLRCSNETVASQTDTVRPDKGTSLRAAGGSRSHGLSIPSDAVDQQVVVTLSTLSHPAQGTGVAGVQADATVGGSSIELSFKRKALLTLSYAGCTRSDGQPVNPKRIRVFRLDADGNPGMRVKPVIVNAGDPSISVLLGSLSSYALGTEG